MTKTALWWVIGAVVVTGGVVMLSGSSDMATTDEQMMEEGGEMMGGNSMVSGAFTGSGSIKCDYTQADGFVGVAYIKGGKVRIDGVANGAASNIIYGGDKVYIWGSSGGQEYGLVMDAAANAQVATGYPALPTRVALESQFNADGANCENYRASNSLFTPPPSVRFQTMADLMKMAPAGY